MEEAYVVHVDDDKDDAQWLKESFSLYRKIAVRHFPDAGSFLKANAELSPKISPCLMVIDLNLPDIKGLELIAKIKSDPIFNKVPIVVYTTGYSPVDKAKCDKLNIELFKKPNTVQDWQAIGEVMALRCTQALAN
jgi:CheY-like chemotaxis protein